jgi:tetratricopeptide (TPR) repeat protein/predicted Ser/Thr protein kinase
MTAARWAQLKEIFSAATERPPEEREAFLDHACPDASLREDVRKLMEAEGRPSLESPMAGILAPPALPAAIGRYRIVRLLGEGGMGAVYEAEQDQPRRTVALKVVKAGLAGAALLRRFEHEAQALGRLHHPGIAQIYEAGAADSGSGPQPYFAMEFIQGASLLRYAKEHGLSTRQRLELMARVCEAVHHAHQRGIIHRDLKPGNILVEETGQPKIVDFGVARVTDADAQATGHTDSGQILGTLAYMSPEQVLADPLELDTRSDVYALGVILYELLAGRLPYQVGGQLPQAVQTIREEDPARLSSIDRAYRGDIETIVAKALEKDKARRYASAAELGADIERYLKDEPIVARRSTATYQLRKFARRHSALAAGVAAALVMLIAGVVASTWEAARAWRAEQEALRQRDRTAAARQASQQERDRAVGAERAATQERNRAIVEKQHADTESAAAKAISDFLRDDVLAQANSAAQSGKPDPDLKVRTALDRAAARIAGRFDGQPLVEASIRQTIGQTYQELGVYPEAERQLGHALELRRRNLGEEHADTLDSMTALARVYRSEGKYATAVPLLEKAVETRRRVFGGSHRATLAALFELSLLYQSESKFPKGEPIAAAVLEARRRTLGPQHRDTVSSMASVGILYAEEGKFAQAEPLLEKALDAGRRLDGEEHPNTLDVANSLADLYIKEAKYQLAEPLLVHVLAARRRVLGDEHPQTVITMGTLAAVYYHTGRPAESLSLSEKIVEIWKRTLGPEHPDTLTAMNNLAVIYSGQDRYAESEPLLAQVLEIRRRVLGEGHHDTLSARYNLAFACAARNRLAEAERLLAENVETATRVLGKDHPDTLTYLLMLGIVQRREEKYADAEPALIRVVEARQRVLGPEHPMTVSSVIFLGILYQESNKLAEAESWLAKGLEAGRRVLGAGNGATRSGAESLGKIRVTQKRWGEAEALLRESLNSRDPEGPYSWQMSERRAELGLILMEQSRFAEAEPLLVSGYKGLVERRSVVPKGVSLPQAGERIVQLYTAWGKPDRAAEWRKEVKAAEPVSANSKEH